MTEKNSRQLAQTWPFKRYKIYERELRAAAEKWYSKKGLATHSKMQYCLESLDMWPQNIICTDVADYIQYENERNRGKESFPLHKYLHHGLSSQAMAFNLVGPLIVRNDLEPLRIAIERCGISWPKGEVTAQFEYDDRSVFNEDSGQPTSIDLVISGETKSIFIEVKYTESEFGGCSVFGRGDCDGRNPLVYGLSNCYLHHIGRRYWDILKEFGFDETVITSGPICPFASYYQFFREALFSLKEGGSFMLLYDERNPVFVKTSKDGVESGLWPFLMDSVPAEYTSKIGRLTMQQLVMVIDESGRHHDWIHEFKLKYGFDEYTQTQLE
ncbi:MAG: hypothetical protein RTV31_12020 [Candidatus Thorarchaeota archaeon]